MIAVDIGGTNLRLARLSKDLLIQERVSISTPKDGDSIVLAISNFAREFDEQTPIGISFAGVADFKNGVIINFTNKCIANFPICAEIFKLCGKKAILVHDASAAALGEMELGSAKGVSNFIYVTLSTGIGGAFVFNGKVVDGEHGWAGEIGHMTLLQDGPSCNCGKRGCWEALAAGSGLRNQGLSSKEIFHQVRLGKKEAYNKACEIAHWHGIGLANLINALDPSVIVLGGGQMQSWSIMEGELMATLEEHLYPKRDTKGLIKLAKLGDDGGLVGAAIAARRSQ